MQKLITEIPLIWGVVWLVISLLLSLWYYRKKDWLSEISLPLRALLTFLRFAALSILGVLLLGVMYASKENRVEQPILINVIDNSASMLNYKDSLEVAANIKRYQAALAEEFGGNYEILNFVGNQLQDGDSLSFTGEKSDLSAYFEDLHDRYYQRNIGGIIFYSDGNYNAGINPLYSAEKIKLTPIFTVGVGDTIEKTDQLIREVNVNDIAFLNNQFQVKVNVEAQKLKGREVELAIFKNNKKLAQEKFTYTSDEAQSKQVDFVLNADALGYQNYKVELSFLNEEFNKQNNSFDFYVEVIDGRNKVLLTAAAPHPDLGALKNALADNDNLQTDAVLMDKVESPLTNYDLIVVHDPGALNTDQLQAVMATQKPVLFILGSKTNDNVIENLPIGLSTRLSNQLDDVQGAVNKNFKRFEIEGELSKAISNFPPLQVKYGQMNLANTSDVAIYQSLGNVQTQKPLLSFSESNGVKFAMLAGEGIWRWRIADFAQHQNDNHFNTLVDKLVQYLVLKKDASNLRVKLPKRGTTLDEIIMNAEFYNDNLEQITTPDLQLLLQKGEEENVYDFAKTASNYQLNLGKLPAGKYDWKVYTKFNGRNYEKTGVLVVNAVIKEDLETKANHEVLKQMALQSKGAFFQLNEQSALIENLRNRGDITPITYSSSKYKDLIDFLILFAVVVVLLTLEWFLRRYNGAY